MPDRVYIETTIARYLTSRPSRDVVVAGHRERNTISIDVELPALGKCDYAADH